MITVARLTLLSRLNNHMNRPPYNDHHTMKELVKSGEILDEVEKVVSKLG